MLGALMVLIACCQGDSVATGRDIVRRMYERHAATWYETLAAIQTATYFDSAGGVDHAEVWYESFQLPGRLRSDAAPLERGTGEVFRADSLYRFEGDSVVQEGAAVHVILLLAFDVYRQSVATTVETLERYGFVLDSLREDEWGGRAGWVVGSADGGRFWVDRDDLLLRRLVVPGEGSAPALDVRFEAYEEAGGGWLATERLFLADGRVRIRERDVWWDTGLAFPDDLFAITRRSRPGWVRN